LPSLTLNLVGVAGLTVDLARAGLAALPRSMIAVATDTAVEITLAALPPGARCGWTTTRQIPRCPCLRGGTGSRSLPKASNRGGSCDAAPGSYSSLHA
jgi:hypothetical protein